MRNLILLLTVCCASVAFAQSAKSIEIIAPDNQKTIVTSAELLKYPQHTIDSIQIINHLKEYKSTLKNIKGFC